MFPIHWKWQPKLKLYRIRLPTRKFTKKMRLWIQLQPLGLNLELKLIRWLQNSVPQVQPNSQLKKTHSCTKYFKKYFTVWFQSSCIQKCRQRCDAFGDEFPFDDTFFFEWIKFDVTINFFPSNHIIHFILLIDVRTRKCLQNQSKLWL